MTGSTVGDRLAAIEQELASVRKQLALLQPVKPWWEQIAGSFEGDEDYKQAMELGRQYRQECNRDADAGLEP